MKRSSVIVFTSTNLGLKKLWFQDFGPMKSGPAESEARHIAFKYLREIDTVRIIMVDKPGRRLIVVAGKEKW